MYMFVREISICQQWETLILRQGDTLGKLRDNRKLASWDDGC